MKHLIVVAGLFLIVGCSSDSLESEKETTKPENVVEESNVSINFGDVNIIVKEGDIAHVTGDVKTDSDVFYYTLEQGEHVFVEETEVPAGEKRGEWNVFEIEEPLSEADLEDEEVPIIKLYVKDKDKVINPHFVPIDIVNY